MTRYDTYAAQYAREYDYEQTMVFFRRRLLLERLHQLDPQTVLEVGCGLEPLFAHDPKERLYTVVEPSSQFFAAAQKRRRPEATRIYCASLEACSTQLMGSEFDLIVLSGLLHEVEDCAGFLACVRQLCGPGTRVHVNVPNSHSLHRQLGLAAGFMAALEEPSARALRLDQRRSFDQNQLAATLVGSGFQVVEQGGYFLKPFTHDQMNQLMTTQENRQQIEFGLYQLGRQYPELASEIYCEGVVK